MKISLKSHLFLILFSLTAFSSFSQSDSLLRFFNGTDLSNTSRLKPFVNDFKLKDSTEIAEIALRIVRKENKTAFYHFIGEHFYAKDDFEATRYFYTKSLAAARLTLDKKLIADELSALGDVLRLQDNNTVALNYLLQAMYAYKDLGDQAKLCNTLSLIGDIERCVEQYNDALKYLEEALDLAIKNNYVKDQAFCYSSIGGTYQLQGKYSEAFYHYKKGLLLAQSISDTMRIIDFDYSLADLLIDQNNANVALDYLNEGVKLSHMVNDQYHLGFCYMGLSKAYLKQNQYKRSIEKGLQAYKLGQKLNAYGLCSEASDALYKAYLGVNDYKSAFYYLKVTKDSYDSTMSSDQIKKQAELELNFKNAYKEKQDSLLRASQQKQKDIAHRAELNQQKLLTVSGIVGLIMAAIIAVIVFRYYQKEKKSKQIINNQKLIVDLKNKEIVDSINYAKKIQQAVIPTTAEINSVFPKNFVILFPKDIVSGDFYWITNTADYSFFAVVDCTGHGVPGGFMSMLGMALLNEIVNEKKIYEPADILDVLKIKIIMALRQSENINENKDGMDIALCRVNKSRRELVFAGANNSLYLLRDNTLKEYKGDKHPIGFSFDNTDKQFTQTLIPLEKEDMLYMFTDGYPDQFGGPQGKKFKYKPLEQLLMQIHKLDLHAQQQQLIRTHEEWKGKLEQVDDICVVGLRV